MLSELIRGVLVPAVVTALVLLLGLARKSADRRAWLVPLALGLGFAAGFAASMRKAPWTPASHWEWTWWIVPGCGVAGALLAIPKLPRWLRAVLAVGAVGAFGWLVVPARGFESIAEQRTWWRVAAAGMLALAWLAPAWAGRRMGARTSGLMYVVAASGLAVVLVLGHTARFGQLAGVCAACAGAAWVLALLRPHEVKATAGGLVLAGALVCLALMALFYDTNAVPRMAFILAGVSPACVGITRLAGADKLRGWRGGALHVAIVALALGAAAGFVLSTERPADEYEGLYGAMRVDERPPRLTPGAPSFGPLADPRRAAASDARESLRDCRREAACGVSRTARMGDARLHAAD